jgi:hypothetical protein
MDHAQRFGLSEPVDGTATSQKLLLNKAIEKITLRDDSGDLRITFTGQTELEILNMSSGYEGWEFGADGLPVVATGGGKLTIFGEV